MDPMHRIAEFDPRKKAFSLVDEFKNFAFKGNVIDLAVGVIIGAAFGKIIDSLVKQVMMPLIAALLPADQSYLDWTWMLNGQKVEYGKFLGEIVNFLLVALILFIFIVKFLGWVMRAKKEEAAAPPPLTKDQELLWNLQYPDSRAALPTARIAARVIDCHYFNAINVNSVIDAVRKPERNPASDVFVDQLMKLGHFPDSVEYLLNGRHEIVSQSLPLLFVPSKGFLDVFVDIRVKDQR